MDVTLFSYAFFAFDKYLETKNAVVLSFNGKVIYRLFLKKKILLLSAQEFHENTLTITVCL